MVFELLKNGNRKLGPGVWSMSLPSVTTCPGRGECEKFCYAHRLERFRTHYRLYLEKVHAHVLTEDWVSGMNAEIVYKQPDTIRWHASGDFFSSRYVREWIRIVNRHPGVQFFGYTRSWCVPKILKSLDDLRRRPNVALYASVEEHEWDDPRIREWMRALVIDGYAIPDDKVGIVCPEQVWRQKTGTLVKDKGPASVTCGSCGYCVHNKGNVFFAKH